MRTVALAVDVGGTKIEAALVADDGEIVAGSRFREPTGGRAASAEQLADATASVATRALSARPAGADLLGAGIGSAGPVSSRRGRVSPLNLPGWRDYPVRDLVAALLPAALPTVLRMDGQCITLAEHWRGAGRGIPNFMGMVVSTGVGGGLVLDGMLIAGSSGNAGHIGHIGVPGFDEPCPCGGIGCLEAVASGPRSVAWAREHGWTGETGEHLAASYATGDRVAIAAVERAGRAIGQAIASASALVDLDLVAVGGGFSRVSADLFGHIETAIAERMGFAFVAKTRVVPAALGIDGPLVGAGALIHRAAHVTGEPSTSRLAVSAT